MRKGARLIKRLLALSLVLLMSIESFAAVVSDNDGSAFITKAEFDSLKNSFQAQIDSYNTSIDNKIDGAIASYLAGISISNDRVVSNSFYCDAVNGMGKPIFFLGPGNQKDYYQDIQLDGECYNYMAFNGYGTLEQATDDNGNYQTYSDVSKTCSNFGMPKFEYSGKLSSLVSSMYSNYGGWVKDQLLLKEEDGWINGFDSANTKFTFTLMTQGYGLQGWKYVSIVKLSDDEYSNGFRLQATEKFQEGFQSSFMNNSYMIRDLNFLKSKSLIDFENKWTYNYESCRYKEVFGRSMASSVTTTAKTWLPYEYNPGLVLGSKFNDDYVPIVSNFSNEWVTLLPKDHKTDYAYKGWLKININTSRWRVFGFTLGMPENWALFELVRQKHNFNSYWDLKVKAFTKDVLNHDTGGNGYCYEGLPFYYNQEGSGTCSFDIKLSNFLDDTNSNYYLFVKEGPFPKTFKEDYDIVSGNGLIKLKLKGGSGEQYKLTIPKDDKKTISFETEKGKQYYMQIIGEDLQHNGAITYFSDYKFIGEG